MKIKQFFFIIIGLLVANSLLSQNNSISQTLGNASISFAENRLIVSTGKVQRTWQLTQTGFQTIGYKNLNSGREWCENKPVYSCDWNLPKRIEDDTEGVLISIDCKETDDEHFTSNHLLVSALFSYDCGLEIKYLVRVYPNAPGVWTALEVKANEHFSTQDIPVDLADFKYYGSRQPIKIARNDFIPVDFSQVNKRKYWGIYNDPGNRVNTQDMVREKEIAGYPVFWDEKNTWANGVVVKVKNEGLIVVKESNKTVNKYGHQTGSFYCTQNGLEVTGWGIRPDEISSEFKRTWATWSMLYAGSEDEMELALKQFDRVRFPINTKRDMHILIDTWGSDWQNENFKKIYGRENSDFSVVEKEIESAGDLGIDIVRIDDGWQEGGTMSHNSWHPNTKAGYDAHWEKTKKLAKENKVRIGLWAAIRYITPKEMLNNQKELDVATWKFDFDKLDDHDSFANRIKETRNFIKESGYSTQTSWCPEYDDQRYGWYSAARECGPMYFQNIQNNLPNHLTYVPYITLRHHWMMAKYYNMNDLQCHWQNPSRTNPKFSDANKHSQSYCAMSALMAAPSCFMLTQLLEPEERDELREIIGLYKQYRKEIWESYVFPIGEEPNNASYTGFQIYHPDRKSGYLMVFRELHNDDESAEMNLRFLRNKKVLLTNLETNRNKTLKMKSSKLTIDIDAPAGYKFIKYEILE